MLDKKRMITLILAIFILCSLSSVYASDIDDSAIQMSNDAIGDVVASEVDSEDVDSNVIASEANSEDVDSNAITSVEEDSDGDAIASVDEDVDGDAILSVDEDSDGDAIVSVEENNKESLAATNMHSFEELQNIINKARAGSEINLQNDYSLLAGGNTVTISTSNLIINGNGHTLDGGGNGRIFDVDWGGYGITFKNIKFRNGGVQDRDSYETDAGGAIFIRAPSTIINCVFENNAASEAGGAIYSHDDLTIINSTFFNNIVDSGNGGAVCCEGYLTIDNSRFDNNMVMHGLSALGDMITHAEEFHSAYWYFVLNGETDNIPSTGGAIFCGKSCTVSNSDFNSNQAGQECELGPGGGAIHTIGNITVRKCNFISNKAYDQYGGAIQCNGYGYIYDSNFRNNVAHCGGAVSSFYPLKIYRSNFSNNGNEEGTSFVEAQSVDALFGEIPVIGDYLDDAMSLLELFGVDVPGLSANVPSMGGAVKSKSNIYLESCTFDKNFASDYGGAVHTPASVEAKKCTFASNKVYRGSSAFAEALQWQGAIRDGGAIHAGLDLTVRDSSFTSNSATYEGGALYCGQKCNVYNSDFLYNSARIKGGAIYAEKLETVSNCEFQDNEAYASSGDGGAVFINSKCSPTFTNCEFSGNKASSDGGAIFVDHKDSFLSLSDCIFLKNIAATDGGAVYCRGQTTISYSQFKGNQADGDGSVARSFGGAVNSNGDLTLKYCSFSNNFANNWGGAAYTAGKMTIQNSNFTSNSAKIGGAIYAPVINDEVTNSRFIKNLASNGDGGAIYINNESWPKFRNCVFEENSCKCGAAEKAQGGAIYAYNSYLKLTNCNFTGNSAEHGGAIYVGKVTEISNSRFSKNRAKNNKATGDGGAIYVSEKCSFAIKGSSFEKNIADDRGGAIYTGDSVSPYQDGTLSLSNSNFTGNKALRGGAIYTSKLVNPTNLVFVNNTATGDDTDDCNGGAVFIYNECELEFISCIFENNTARYQGGGIYFRSGDSFVKLTSCSFIGNNATTGGGVYARNVNTIQKTSFINNKAKGSGGGIYIDKELTQNIISSTFENNTAGNKGGGVCAPSAEMKKIQYSTFTGNKATNGSGIYINRISNILDSYFYNNIANSSVSGMQCDGGAVYVDGKCTFNVRGCIFEGNYANTRGGAIYADYGLAPYVHINVSYCSFVNNFANCTNYDANSGLYHGPGHSIFNSGKYDFIGWCWHGNNTPNFKGQFVEWKASVDDADHYPTGFLKIGMKLSESHPVAGNTYKVTIYFYKNTTQSGNLDNNILHSNAIFYGDGVFSNVKSANKNNVTADVVFNQESRIIYGKLNSQVLSISVNPIEKDPCTVNIISCNDIQYPSTLIVNYEISPMSDAIYEIRDIDGVIVKTGSLNNPNTLYVEGLEPGSYFITITNLESESHLPGSANASFNVSKGYLGDFSIIVWGKTPTEDVKGIIMSPADGNYTVEVAGTTTEVTVKDNYGYFNLGTLDNGEYEARAYLISSELYSPTSSSTTFTVSDEFTPFEIDLGNGEFYFGESIAINPVLPNGATGTILYELIRTSLDQTESFDTEVGRTFTLPILDIGHYILTAFYLGDNNFDSAGEILEFDVSKIPTTFDFDAIQHGANDWWFMVNNQLYVANGSAPKIFPVLPNGATGTVKYYLSNGNFLGETEVGGTFTLPKWNVGIYQIIANYSGDENLDPASIMKLVIVSSYDSTRPHVSIAFYDAFNNGHEINNHGNVFAYGETPIVYCIEPNEYSRGSVAYYVNGTYIGTRGIYENLTLDVLEPGQYVMMGVSSEDSIFGVSRDAFMFYIRTPETAFDIEVVDDEINYGETTVITHTLPDGATGTIAYYLDDGTFLGEAPAYKNFTLPKVKGGIQSIVAKYSGDLFFIYANASTSLTVNKIEVPFNAEVSPSEIRYGEELSISPVLPDDATGTIAYYLSDGTFLGETEVGESFTLSKLDAGTHEIIANYSGDNSYLPAVCTVSLTVIPAETFEFNAEGSEFGHGEEASISPVLPDDATGTIAYYLSDGTFLGETEVGESFSISKLDAGNHEIVLNYSGDSNYASATYTVSVNVTKVETPEFTLPYSIFAYGEDNKINPVLPDDATGTLKYYFTDGTLIGTVAAGESFTLPAWDVGSYIIVVTYSGDSNYDYATDSAQIIIEKVPSKLNVSMSFDYNGVGTTYASFDDAKGIEASVLDQPNAIVTVSGNAITVSGLDVGTYTLRVTTITDGNHIPVTETTSVIVNKAKTALTASAVTATYNVNKNLVATLKDAKGKALSGVKVNVVLSNGKKLTLTTDKNGQIKVSTKGLAPKTYTATITFAGNKNCLKSTKTVKITVKKASPKLTAKAQSFKKSLKTKKYVVTLKNNVNKAMAKTQVTIKVGGTTYKATTNAKGQATFKMTKLNKKGTFTAVITYKGSANYNKVTKKVKITVK